MARAFTTNQYLIAGSAVHSAVPFTMACWFKSSSDAVNQTLMALGPSGNNSRQFALRADGNQAGDPVVASARQTGTAGANTSTGYTVGQWHHAAGVFASISDRRAFIDGGSKGTNSTSRTPSGIDRTIIGAEFDSDGASDFSEAEIAECAFWGTALTDEEIAVLATGVCPLFVRPNSLSLYLPGVRDADKDLVGGLSFTPTNTPTIAAHTRIMRVVPPFTRFTAAGGGAPPAILTLNRIEREIGRGAMRGVVRGAA